jgi:nucleoside-diphosphate-sugar epimerase
MLNPASSAGAVSTVDAVIHTAQYGIQGRFTHKKLQQIVQADVLMARTLSRESEAFGQTYNIVDNRPVRLCELVNTFTDVLGKKRVSSMAPWLLKLIIGAPLVDALVTSFRISNAKAKRELGWQPRYSTCGGL